MNDDKEKQNCFGEGKVFVFDNEEELFIPTKIKEEKDVNGHPHTSLRLTMQGGETNTGIFFNLDNNNSFLHFNFDDNRIKVNKNKIYQLERENSYVLNAQDRLEDFLFIE